MITPIVKAIPCSNVRNFAVRNRLKGMNQHNAAIAAGYSETYAKQACRVEKLVEVSISDALEQAGITAKYQAKELLKLAKGKNPNVKIRTWEHISELRKQTSKQPIVTTNNIKKTFVYLDSKALKEESARNNRVAAQLSPEQV